MRSTPRCVTRELSIGHKDQLVDNLQVGVTGSPKTETPVDEDALHTRGRVAAELRRQLENPSMMGSVLREWVETDCSEGTLLPGLGRALTQFMMSPRHEDSELAVRWLTEAARVSATAAASIVFDFQQSGAMPSRIALYAGALTDLDSPTGLRIISSMDRNGSSREVVHPTIAATLVVQGVRGLQVLEKIGYGSSRSAEIPYAGDYLFDSDRGCGPLNLVQMALLDLEYPAQSGVNAALAGRDAAMAAPLIALSYVLSLLDLESPAVRRDLAHALLDKESLPSMRSGKRMHVCWLAAMLVNAGADIESFPQHFENRYYNGDTRLIELLCGAAAPPTTHCFQNADLVRAAERVMDVMGADPNAWDSKGKLLLHHALEGGNPEMVTMLIRRGTQTDFRPPVKGAYSAVEYARKLEADMTAFGIDFDAGDMERMMLAARAKKVVDVVLAAAHAEQKPTGA
jgi:hypothetical protein